MHITIDQAQAFEAVARLGTIQKAAKSLHKGHSAILYLLRTLESQLELKLFDRSGYRNKISSQGEVVLKYCQQLINTRDELSVACDSLRGGWEPSIKLIYDGVVDFNSIADAFFQVNWADFPTEVKITAAFMREVESKFIEEKADLMLTILPINIPGIFSIPLAPIKMLLVANKNHPLVKFKERTKAQMEDLKKYAFIKVRDTSGELGLSTDKGIFKSVVMVNDFPTKKEAILRGMGFGWLPEYLVHKELKNRDLSLIRTEIENETLFHPRLYHRKPELIGKAVKKLINFYK